MNRTGVIEIKDADLLIMVDSHSNNGMEHSVKMPPIITYTSRVTLQGDHQNMPAHDVADLFGEKEKSKTTNIAELLLKNSAKNGTQSTGPTAVAKPKLDNTYDISKLKRASFLSQSK